MRVDSQSGYVKWAKAFYIKSPSTSYVFNSLTISQDDTAWILHLKFGNPYVDRISANGTILQVIMFGSLNLSYSPNASFITVISESEFVIAQDVSYYNGNLSIGGTTGTDITIARISTNLNIR